MSTQVQGLSDNLEEIKSRLGKLNQQLVDLQNTVQSVDAKISGGSVPPGAAPASSPGGASVQPTGSPAGSPAGSAPSADTLYSNGLRDITSGKYDLARSEFQDYLRYYSSTDLAGNAQFYLGEIAYSHDGILRPSANTKGFDQLSKSFKLAPARLKNMA
jgi:TolA-binding protein